MAASGVLAEKHKTPDSEIKAQSTGLRILFAPIPLLPWSHGGLWRIQVDVTYEVSFHQHRNLEIREHTSLKRGKTLCPKLNHYLHDTGLQTALLFAPGLSISIFQGYLLYRHPWKEESRAKMANVFALQTCRNMRHKSYSWK